jgi:hypothetical protein
LKSRIGILEEKKKMKDPDMVKYLLLVAKKNSESSGLLTGFFKEQKASGLPPFDFFTMSLARSRDNDYPPKVIKRICKKIRSAAKKPSIRGVIRIIEYELSTASIVIDENPYEEDLPDERFNDSVIQSLENEMSGRPVVKIKNKEFGEQSERLEIWSDTESHLRNVFLATKDARTRYKKVYVFDASSFELDSANSIRTFGMEEKEQVRFKKDKKEIEREKNSEDVLLPEDLQPSKEFLEQRERRGTKSLLVSDAIIEAMRDRNRVLVLTGNHLAPGGNSDQGMISNETPLFLASTISMALSKTIQYHPRLRNELIFVPDVFVFKNHLARGFPAFAEGGRTISVLITSGPFLSENECENAIKSCLFFGKTELVFDNGGDIDEDTRSAHWNSIRLATNKLAPYLTKSYVCVERPQVEGCKEVMLRKEK